MGSRGNLYHEYLVEDDFHVPLQSILGAMHVNFEGINFADEKLRMLLPQLWSQDQGERLEMFALLERCRQPFNSEIKQSITRRRIFAAFELAYCLLRPAVTGHTAEDRVAVTVMFLALLPRNWEDNGYKLLMQFFQGVFFYLVSAVVLITNIH